MIQLMISAWSLVYSCVPIEAACSGPPPQCPAFSSIFYFTFYSYMAKCGFGGKYSEMPIPTYSSANETVSVYCRLWGQEHCKKYLFMLQKLWMGALSSVDALLQDYGVCIHWTNKSLSHHTLTLHTRLSATPRPHCCGFLTRKCRTLWGWAWASC